MKIYRLALIFLITITFGTLSAQSFENLESRNGKNLFDKAGWELYIRRTQVSAKYTFNYGGTTFNAKFRADDFRKGAWRYHFENPTLGDMIWGLGRLLRGKGDLTGPNGSEQAFGSGFFGWHQVYWNTVAKDRLLVCPGMSFGDYIFGSRRGAGDPASNGSNAILDPAGYYFHLGPSLMVTQMVGNSAWVNLYTRYDLTTRAGKPSGLYQPTAGYKNPHFFGLGASVQHTKTRLCGGVNYTHMIDRGVNKDAASRIDISFGLML